MFLSPCSRIFSLSKSRSDLVPWFLSDQSWSETMLSTSYGRSWSVMFSSRKWLFVRCQALDLVLLLTPSLPVESYPKTLLVDRHRAGVEPAWCVPVDLYRRSAWYWYFFYNICNGVICPRLICCWSPTSIWTMLARCPGSSRRPPSGASASWPTPPRLGGGGIHG